MSISSKEIAWDSVVWQSVDDRVSRVQRRIYKARLSNNSHKVHWLQKLLINSTDAKLLAIRQVTTLNKSRMTPGVDKKLVITAKSKMELVNSLKLDVKCGPIRRAWIAKPGKAEMRPLKTPTIQDRAKQALAKFALEPEWEAVFEPNSYGFRPRRSAHDAIEAIFLSLRHNKPKWIYNAEIIKCYEKIDHTTLLKKLQTFTLMEKQVEAWLKAGVLEEFSNKIDDAVRTSSGTPQGDVISPLLVNVALHGLENHLKAYVSSLSYKSPMVMKKTATIQSALSIIRYADDFVLIHADKKMLEFMIEETRLWLRNMGLELNTEKSVLRNGQEGFCFLGFHIIQLMKAGRFKVKMHPSKASKMKYLDNIRSVIQKNKAASAYHLIKLLRPRVIGWANYFKFCECKNDFRTLSHLTFQKIRAWVFRRGKKQNRRFKLKQKYFPENKLWRFDNRQYKDNWVLYGSTKETDSIKKETFLPHLVWVASRKHVKIKESKSPYDGDYEYWLQRSEKYEKLTKSQKVLFKRQSSKCNICRKALINFDTMELDHIVPKSKGGKDTYTNLQLVHRQCHFKKTAQERKIP